jgi:hypothetical protein
LCYTSSPYGTVQDGPYLKNKCTSEHDGGGKSMPTQDGRAEVPFYPDDLLPQLQQTLATLADLQLRYEIEREYLEGWSGPSEVKDYLLAELEQCHRANRERFVSCLEGLRLKSRGLGPATLRRTDH